MFLLSTSYRPVRRYFSRYAVAWCYLGCYLVVEAVYAALGPDGQATLIGWASTNVANLEHEPVGPLVLSAFIGPGYDVIWPALIALALFPANRALGNRRCALIGVGGQVLGTLVSEGIVAYRVDIGQLPVTDRHLIDVGPSYVVLAAVVAALLCGTWLLRALAALDFAILVFGSDIFAGLSHCDVAAVGHLTAAVTAAAAVGLIALRRAKAAKEPTRTPARRAIPASPAIPARPLGSARSLGPMRSFGPARFSGPARSFDLGRSTGSGRLVGAGRSAGAASSADAGATGLPGRFPWLRRLTSPNEPASLRD